MEINVEVSGADNERVSIVDETVEVVDGDELRPGAVNAPPGLVADQQIIVAHPQEVLVPSTEVSCLIMELTYPITACFKL